MLYREKEAIVKEMQQMIEVFVIVDKEMELVNAKDAAEGIWMMMERKGLLKK